MRRIRMAVAAAVLASVLGSTAGAVYTDAQLSYLRDLVEAGNTQAIEQYIEEHPELLVGEDAVAVALRDFVKQRSGPLGSVFGAGLPDLSGVPQTTATLSIDEIQTGTIETGSIPDGTIY